MSGSGTEDAATKGSYSATDKRAFMLFGGLPASDFSADDAANAFVQGFTLGLMGYAETGRATANVG